MVKKLFRKMLPAQIISSLATALCMQIDIILIGQFIGVDGVASYGFINPILIIFTAVSGLIACGVSTVCSQFIGKGEQDNVSGNFTTAILLTIAISVVFTALIAIFVRPITAFLGAPVDSEVFNITCDYLKGYIIGFPAYMFTMGLTPYLHLAGKRNLVIISIAVMTFLDIVLDVLNGAVIKQGMLGMGLASSISFIASALIIITYFFKKNCMFKFRLKHFSCSHIGKIFITGMPIAINQVCYSIFIFVVNRLLLYYGGEMGIAAFSVIISVSTICFTISSGVGGVSQNLSGIFYGEKDRENLLSTIKNGLIWSLVLNIIVAAVLFVLADAVAGIYVTDDPATLAMTAVALRFYMPAIIPMGIAVLFKNYYPCIGKLPLAIYVCLGENLVFAIGFAYLLSVVWGLYGIFALFIFSETLTVVEIFIITFILNKKISLSLSSLSIISKIPDIQDSNILNLNIKAKDTVSQASESAGDFCKSLGFNTSMANYVALCIEEIAVEIIDRGFKAGKDNLIEIRILKMDDGWTIRFRDNCENFDPVNYMKLHSTDDPLAHLGIHMVFKMVTDATYINPLGLNCLTLQLKSN